MNEIIERCFFATGISLAAGAFLILLIASRKRAEIDIAVLWKKFWVYWMIIVLMEASIFAGISKFIFPVIVFIGLAEMVVVAFKNENPPSKTILIFSFFCYTIFAVGFLFFPVSGTNIILQVYVIVIVFDGFSQLFGQLLGKRKLAAKISPAKTWEGAAGGLLMAALICTWIEEDYHGAVIGVVIGTFALLGDLLASKYKRLCGVKDFGRWIPFHGGMLDRFDSFMVVGSLVMLVEWLFFVFIAGT